MSNAQNFELYVQKESHYTKIQVHFNFFNFTFFILISFSVYLRVIYFSDWESMTSQPKQNHTYTKNVVYKLLQVTLNSTPELLSTTWPYFDFTNQSNFNQISYQCVSHKTMKISQEKPLMSLDGEGYMKVSVFQQINL